MYLRQPAIADIVVRSIQTGVVLGHYDLGAYAIMPNHVHLLILPKTPPDQLMKSLKGSTAREANRALGRTGETFWQKESYDHWVRDRQELERIRAYIQNNPVNAGLVRAPQDFPWSSASVENSLDAARKSACAT
jgi:REP element-mobilizing transposase RayT